MLEIEKDSLMQNGASLPLYCLRGRLDQMGAGLVKEMADAFFLDHPSKDVGESEGEEEAPALSLSLEALEAVDYEGLSALSSSHPPLPPKRSSTSSLWLRRDARIPFAASGLWRAPLLPPRMPHREVMGREGWRAYKAWNKLLILESSYLKQGDC